MKCLTGDECSRLALEVGITWKKGARVTSTTGGALQSATVRVPDESRGQAILINRLFDTYSGSTRWLLWLHGWGIWTSEEYPDVWYAVRERFGETRSVLEAPGQLLAGRERDLARGMTRLALLFGWDALLVSDPLSIVAKISHENLVDLYAFDSESLAGLCTELRRSGIVIL